MKWFGMVLVLGDDRRSPLFFRPFCGHVCHFHFQSSFTDICLLSFTLLLETYLAIFFPVHHPDFELNVCDYKSFTFRMTITTHLSFNHQYCHKSLLCTTNIM